MQRFFFKARHNVGKIKAIHAEGGNRRPLLSVEKKLEEPIMLKTFRVIFSLLLILGFSATLTGKEGVDTYFPHAIGSYWIYADQDGNELTRRTAADKTVAGETYHAFSYEPALEDWADYDYHIYPNFCQVGEEWVTFLVADDLKKAVEARLTREAEVFRKLLRTEGLDLLYNIELGTQDPLYVLPISITANKQWDATRIKAKVTMRPDPPQDPVEVTLDFTIVETGKVLGTENVETPAGTFKDCLKIEYRTKTEVASFPPAPEGELHPSGESITTLWVAPNIGIVKFHREMEDVLLKAIPRPQLKASITTKTLELKRYEIQSAN
ncbi:MAG: hypothetical protein OXU36_08740 [Candidatus Poribacteria bacterium]|nr:hypothetical protein [Candidatus Poribacteria bacterium]